MVRAEPCSAGDRGDPVVCRGTSAQVGRSQNGGKSRDDPRVPPAGPTEVRRSWPPGRYEVGPLLPRGGGWPPPARATPVALTRPTLGRAARRTATVAGVLSWLQSALTLTTQTT